MNMSIVRYGGLVLSVVVVLLSRVALAGDAYVLVKVSGMNRVAENQVMSATELKELEKTIQLEKKHFQNALQLAAKAWREDESNKGTVFPAGRLTARSIVSTKRFETQEKAEAELNRCYEQEARKEDRERNKTKGAAKSKEESEREKRKESDTSRAAELVTAKIAELISAKPGAAAPEAPAAGGEKKADEKKDAAKAGVKAL